jgi:hypothetical protein
MARAGGRGVITPRGWGRVAAGYAVGFGAVRLYRAAGGGWGCPEPRPATRRPRGWAWATCLVPVLGFTVPHGLWMLGIGMPAEQLAEIRSDLDGSATIVLPLAVPAIGGLVSLGLACPWGQVLPAWAPLVGGRRVPRSLALARSCARLTRCVLCPPAVS